MPRLFSGLSKNCLCVEVLWYVGEVNEIPLSRGTRQKAGNVSLQQAHHSRSAPHLRKCRRLLQVGDFLQKPQVSWPQQRGKRMAVPRQESGPAVCSQLRRSSQQLLVQFQPALRLECGGNASASQESRGPLNAGKKEPEKIFIRQYPNRSIFYLAESQCCCGDVHGQHRFRIPASIIERQVTRSPYSEDVSGSQADGIQYGKRVFGTEKVGCSAGGKSPSLPGGHWCTFLAVAGSPACSCRLALDHGQHKTVGSSSAGPSRYR